MNFLRTAGTMLCLTLICAAMANADARPKPAPRRAKPAPAPTQPESAKPDVMKPLAQPADMEDSEKKPVKPITVVVWGDSIAAGTDGLDWPSITERTYNVALNQGRPVRVINAAVGGMATGAAKEQFDSAIKANAPDIVIIQFGLNDLRYDGSRGPAPISTLAEYKDNLTEMVKRCRDEAKARVVLFGNHKTRVNLVMPSGRTYDEARAEYCSAMRQVALQNKVEFHDLSQELTLEGATWTDFLSVDGVHLSPLGFNAYGRFAANVIARTVR